MSPTSRACILPSYFREPLVPPKHFVRHLDSASAHALQELRPVSAGHESPQDAPSLVHAAALEAEDFFECDAFRVEANDFGHAGHLPGPVAEPLHLNDQLNGRSCLLADDWFG